MKISALIAVAGIATVATADVHITEAFVGLSGPDGTEDWIELTNFGASDVSLGGLFYDDESADITAGGDLPNYTLGAGQSVVILVSVGAGDEAAAITEFQSIWGNAATVFAVDGGGLGQGGDEIFILDGMSGVVDSVVTPGGLSGGLSTIQFDEAGNASPSILGVNGAYLSAGFVNENIDPTGNPIQLVGNPGFVPTPSAVALLGLGGLVAGRRRR